MHSVDAVNGAATIRSGRTPTIPMPNQHAAADRDRVIAAARSELASAPH
jgi:hypothetical protein